MEKPKLDAWIIPALTAAAAVITARSGSFTMTLHQAIVGYSIVMGLGFFQHFVRYGLWKRGQSKTWLDEEIQCSGLDCDKVIARRVFWKLDSGAAGAKKGKKPSHVCAECYREWMGRGVNEGKPAKRAFG